MDSPENVSTEAQQPRREAPEVMLKRIFVVAEIIAGAKSRRENPNEQILPEKTQETGTVVL